MAEINLINSFSTSGQIPLDSKLYIKTLSEISSLGVNNINAYKFFEDMTVQCVEDHSNYIWREELSVGEPNGLLSESFTYPPNVITAGIDYSDRTFNFFKSDFALINGSPTETFKVAHGVNDEDAVNKAQLDSVTEITTNQNPLQTYFNSL